ncbi:hypothetical protein J0W64_14340 [Clostridioides difficile]|nr:hypothetical protein [Clostridioides difficile]
MKILSLFWGFILTKWYVNKDNWVFDEELANSFILTKWYVNLDIVDVLFEAGESFILTKWYVNTFFVFISSVLLKVLY